MAISWPAPQKFSPSPLLAAAVIAFVGCDRGGGNVNAPRGNAIGDRHADFMRVVAHARTLPAGNHSYLTLPAELQIKNLLAVYVWPGKAYALHFPSHPIDSDPVYVYVEPISPDPDAVAHQVVADHGGWQLRGRLHEPGWYYVAGP